MSATKVAVIGAGNWGKNIIRVLFELGALSCICDRNAASPKLKKYSDDYNCTIERWENILTDESITAVVIALPAEQHEAYVQQALKHNKHVFVEKPLALSSDVAKNLRDLAHKQNRVLMVGHILQYHNAYIKLKELIKANVIGDIKYIESTRLHMGPIRYQAGIIWELLPHDISMLLGICNSPTYRVESHSQEILSNTTSPNYSDIINVHIKFENGVLGKVKSSWLHPRKEQKFWVAGNKGMLVFEDTLPWEEKLILYTYNTQSDTSNSAIVTKENIELNAAEPLKQELVHFLGAIENKISVVTDGDEGYRVVELLEQISTCIAPRVESLELTDTVY